MRDPNTQEYWTPKHDPVSGARSRLQNQQAGSRPSRTATAVLIVGALAAAFAAYAILG